MVNYEKYRFSRGYLIANRQINTEDIQNWSEEKLGEYYFYFHPMTKWAVHLESNGTWCVIIGKALDIINETSNLEEISEHLKNEFNKSTEAFYDYVEELVGRYVIVISDNNNVYALSDATGMKTIFYHKSEKVLSSHARLLSLVTEEDRLPNFKNKWLSDYSAYYLPGNITPYNNILQLVPNHIINVENSEIKRYFPRENLPDLTLDQILDQIVDKVNKQAKLLESENILLSLSGGADSRSSLALLKNISRDLKLFTYYLTDSDNKDYKGNKILNTDQKIASDIVNNLNLNHRFIPIDQAIFATKDFEQFKSLLMQNTYLSHNYKLAKLYYDFFSGQDYLHIRSNVHVVAKAFYRNSYKIKEKEMTFDNQIVCYSPKALNDNVIKEIFEEYNNTFNPRLNFNYDPFDIVAWEYRLGMWHSHLLIESDPAFESHSLFNSQKILSLLLSVPLSERKNHTIIKKLIEKAWPILQVWDINKERTILERYDAQISDYGSDLTEAKFISGNLYDKNAKVPMYQKTHFNTLKFHIDRSGPKKGDFAAVKLPIKLTGDPKDIILHLRSPYESRQLKGRMKYEVYYGDKLIVEEDIALWKETNQITIPSLVSSDNNSLIVRVVAKKNCESWSFGRAGTVIIERVVIRNAADNGKKVSVTSPFSKVYKQKTG